MGNVLKRRLPVEIFVGLHDIESITLRYRVSLVYRMLDYQKCFHVYPKLTNTSNTTTISIVDTIIFLVGKFNL